jgi:hypothetical protein
VDRATGGNLTGEAKRLTPLPLSNAARNLSIGCRKTHDEPGVCKPGAAPPNLAVTTAR